MKKFLLAVAMNACLFGAQAQYQEIQGEKANSIVEHSTFIRWNENFKVPNFVEYQVENSLNVNSWQTQALAFIKEPGINQFELYKSETDQLGWVHERYIQKHFNIPVEGSMVIAHSRNGKLISWNGEYFSGLPAVKDPVYTKKEALNKAMVFYPAELYMWQNPLNEQFIKTEQENPQASFFPKGELVYKSIKNELAPGSFRLCWKFNIYAEIPLKRANIYIDAITGELIDSEDLIHTGNVIGTAQTKYSGTRTINTDSTAPTNFRLRQTKLGNGVETYNLQRSTSYSSTDFIDADNNWNNVNSNKDEVATDAHFGAEQTYLYYYNRYGRKSYDNYNSKLRSYVHYSSKYDNAFWDGQRMTYGDGNQLKPLVCIDVAAHEMSHGVTGNSSKLAYSGESGALNESFSDVFAACVEYMVSPGTADFNIGEQLTSNGSALRSMSNPTAYGDPGAYLGPNWYSGNADNGGVHTNSGVQNHWFYILVKGEKATNFKGNAYNVRGIGYDTAGAIAYRNNAFYLTPNSKYADARFYSIQAAKDLYGKCSDAVKQTTNAWYAVNVGTYFDTTVKADFYANPLIYCSVKDSAVFYNSSSLSGTYLWDFGDGKTSTLETPKHKYPNYGKYTIKLKIQGCGNNKTDSMTKVNYIQVDSTLGYCTAYKLPATGGGTTYTVCKGTLKDNGGDNNYSNNTDAYAVIAPTNASYIKLTFIQFNMESPTDFVYLYEGTNTSGKLIGRYSGNTLPNGGVIYSSTGAVTVRQYSDASLNYSGFVLDWQCIPKVTNDAGISSINNITGRENTTLSLKSNEPIKVTIKNFGSNTISNIPVKYQVNGGTIVSETYTGSLTTSASVNYTFNQTYNFSNGGYYMIEAWTELKNDSINTQNDGVVKTIKQIKNQPVKLPYFQGFEGNAALTILDDIIGLDSSDEYDYTNTRADNGRLRTNAGIGYYNGGQRAITFDQYPATNTSGPNNTNLLRLTLNLSNYITNNIYLDFAFMNHGDESTDSDKVWVRGNDQAAWIQLYNLQTLTNFGVYNAITGLDISSALKNAGQVPSKSTQILFGQKNNGTSTSPTGNDGITFDDISVWTDVKDVGIATMTKPTTGCGRSNSEVVEVEVFNYGTALNNVSGKINMRLNNGSIISQNVVFNIARNQTQKLSFTQTVDLSSVGTYIIDTWTTLIGDVDATNDSLTEKINSMTAMTPLVITPSGPLAFCNGDSVILSANSGYQTYTWSNGKITPNITVKTTGNYTCTVTNSIGCTLVQSKAVTVSNQPTAGFNWSVNKNLVSFSNLSIGATSYMWYFGDGDSSNLINPTHIYAIKGSYVTKLYAYNSCWNNSDQHSITISVLGVNDVVESNYAIYPNPFDDKINISFVNYGSHDIRIYDISGRQVFTDRVSATSLTIDLAALPQGMYMLMIDGSKGTKIVKQ